MRPTAPPLRQKIAGGRGMRRKTVQFFPDIGLGRQHERLLMQTVLVEIAVSGKHCERLREARPDRLGLAGRGIASAACVSAAIFSSRAERTVASTAPSLCRMATRDASAVSSKPSASARARHNLGFVLGRIEDFDDAAHGKKSVEGRGRDHGRQRDCGDRRDELAQQILVDANFGGRGFALRGKGHMDRSTVRVFARFSRVRPARSHRRAAASASLASRPLALTDLSSQARRHGPALPAARAKPVMLASVIVKFET